MAGEKEFTLEELAKFNGADGKPAYFAYRGKVYEVTGSDTWENGDHLGPIRRAPISPKPWQRPRMAKKCWTPSLRSGF